MIEASLPGVKKQKISVEIAANTVRIKGQINLDSRRNESVKYLLRKRRRQDFNKEFLLPKTVNQRETEAELCDGKLEWTRIDVTG